LEMLGGAFVVPRYGYARLDGVAICAWQSFFTGPPHGFAFTQMEEAPTMESSGPGEWLVRFAYVVARSDNREPGYGPGGAGSTWGGE
jgi:hypothetical protein